MKRFLLACALVALALVPAPAQKKAAKGTRYAFLVACSGYSAGEFRKLGGTVKELTAFRDLLLASGFDKDNIVFLHDDATRDLHPERKKILDQLDLLLARLDEEDELLVALDGHGLHFKGDKTSYFVPVDGEFDDKKTLVPLEGKDGLFDLVKASKAKRKVLLVNACRNDPLAKGDFAARRVKIDTESPPEVPTGVAALFSCAPDQRSFEYGDDARDGKAGRSLFYHHVMQAWKGEYSGGEPVTIEHMFKEVRRRAAADAAREYRKKQVAQPYRRYEGEWILNEKPGKEEVTKGWPKEITNGIGMKFVRIPKGKFTMGSPAGEKDRSNDETQHEVEITKDFHLGVFTVTQAQFKKVMGYNPSYFSKDGTKRDGDAKYPYGDPAGGSAKVTGLDTDDFPVENVSHDEAVEFCKRLSALAAEKREKHLYTLPTEAQWEYSCRGGATSYQPFPFGDNLNGDHANCHGNYPYGTDTKGPYLQRTCKVGSYKANGFGLHDMSGNVWQWCADWYGEDYYASSPAADPPGPSKGSYRVIRGGSWNDYTGNCRSANRFRYAPSYRSSFVGFRASLVPSR